MRERRGIDLPARLRWQVGGSAYVFTRRITTWRGYESAVRLHIMQVLGQRRIEKLTGADVRHLIAARCAKCLCCVNRYDRRRPEEKWCCSAGRCCGRTPAGRQIQFIHAVLRNALSSAERDELVTRNVAKLVQIPTHRYRVGKGLPVADATKLLAEAKKTRLYAQYAAGQDSTLTEARSLWPRPFSEPTASWSSTTPSRRRRMRRCRCHGSLNGNCSRIVTGSSGNELSWGRSGGTTAWCSRPAWGPRWSRAA